jgi:hypothetical protein
MSYILSKRLEDLDGIFLVDKVLRPHHYSLMESNDTVSIAKEMFHGLPLGYYDHLEIANMSISEMSEFYESIDFIVKSTDEYSPLNELYDFTVDDGIAHMKIAKIAMDRMCTSVYKDMCKFELDSYIAINNNTTEITNIIRDTNITRDSITFNATGKLKLVLTNFRLLDGQTFDYDINIICTRYVAEKTHKMSNYDPEHESLWRLLSYIKSVFSSRDNDMTQVILDYVKYITTYNMKHIILGNYIIPYLTSIVNKSIDGVNYPISYVLKSHKHDTFIEFKPAKGRLYMSLTNFITSRMSSESTRPGISEINQDQIIAKLIYDNGVI